MATKRRRLPNTHGDTPIASALRPVRDLSQDTWFRDGLLAHRKDHHWHQFFVALDVLEDTELASNAFRSWFRAKDDWGRSYLYIFGLLQSLVVQQDALEHIYVAIGEKPSLWRQEKRDLDEIREARVALVGHPTHQAVNRPEPEFTAITRMSLGQTPTALTFIPNGDLIDRTFNLVGFATRQQGIVRRHARRLQTLIERRIDAHRARFRKVALASFVPLDFAKHALAQMSAGDGQAAARRCRASLGKLVSELNRRGLNLKSYEIAHYRGELLDLLPFLERSEMGPFEDEFRTTAKELTELLDEIDRLHYQRRAATLISKRHDRRWLKRALRRKSTALPRWVAFVPVKKEA